MREFVDSRVELPAAIPGSVAQVGRSKIRLTANRSKNRSTKACGAHAKVDSVVGLAVAVQDIVSLSDTVHVASTCSTRRYCCWNCTRSWKRGGQLEVTWTERTPGRMHCHTKLHREQELGQSSMVAVALIAFGALPCPNRHSSTATASSVSARTYSSCVHLGCRGDCSRHGCGLSGMQTIVLLE